MERIGVVHLARAKNGLRPFENFLQSYRKHAAGMTHDLIIVYKGFRSQNQISPWEEVANAIPHKAIAIPDFGFDMRAYRLAAERTDHRYLFFLNSFSEILDVGWLEKLLAVIQRQGVGIVGATGSWESMYSNALTDLHNAHSFPEKVTAFVRTKACQCFFTPFPNYHIRTNAFLMEREVMLKLWPRYILTKRGAYLFENGRHGLTKRLGKMALRPVVVDRDGAGWEKEDWDRSKTFRISNQESLLVADNQTRIYQNADPARRNILASSAWGDRAFQHTTQ